LGSCPVVEPEQGIRLELGASCRKHRWQRVWSCVRAARLQGEGDERRFVAAWLRNACLVQCPPDEAPNSKRRGGLPLMPPVWRWTGSRLPSARQGSGGRERRQQSGWLLPGQPPPVKARRLPICDRTVGRATPVPRQEHQFRGFLSLFEERLSRRPYLSTHGQPTR